VINALVFAFPTLLLYPALAAYPISIALRGLGWSAVRPRIGPAGRLFPAIWGLGAATYAAVILYMLEVFREGLWIAMAAWPAYSAVEAVLYLSAAMRLRARLLFVSPIGLGGVGAVEAVGLIAMASGPSVSLSSAGSYSILLPVGSALLASSALAAALGFYYVGSERGRGGRVVEELLAAEPQRRPTPSQPMASRGHTLRLAVRPGPAAVPAPGAMPASTRLLQIEAVSRSESLVCQSCGSTAPLEAESCRSCGARFVRSGAGLRCPVCSAPFTLARQVARGHYVCGQCFSDLRVAGGA